MRHDPPRAVIVGESGRCSIPEALVMEPARRGVLVTPHVRGMTTEFCRTAFFTSGVFSWALSAFVTGKNTPSRSDRGNALVFYPIG
jgi:hypothetical protein